MKNVIVVKVQRNCFSISFKAIQTSSITNGNNIIDEKDFVSVNICHWHLEKKRIKRKGFAFSFSFKRECTFPCRKKKYVFQKASKRLAVNCLKCRAYCSTTFWNVRHSLFFPSKKDGLEVLCDGDTTKKKAGEKWKFLWVTVSFKKKKKKNFFRDTYFMSETWNEGFFYTNSFPLSFAVILPVAPLFLLLRYLALWCFHSFPKVLLFSCSCDCLHQVSSFLSSRSLPFLTKKKKNK